MNEPVFLNDAVVRTSAMLDMIRTVLRRMLLATVIGAVLGSGIGYLIAQMPGVWAALVAAGIGLFFTGTTVLLIYLVVGRGPELLQLVLLGGWIIKMAVVLVLLLWLRNLDFYHRETFVGVLILLALTLVAVELVTVIRTPLPAVDLSQRAPLRPGFPVDADQEATVTSAASPDDAPGPDATAGKDPGGEHGRDQDQVG
ncbi:hypothetical protein [Pseudactinotalea sp. Z1748]|uniref:hypothetical protein n=1 Tax=Pseudactinotalea sp. Z1748 TaxID=3413027 RepID=UPI003C7EA084